MMDSSQEEQAIQEEMQKGSEQLEKGKDKKASESQQTTNEIGYLTWHPTVSCNLVGSDFSPTLFRAALKSGPQLRV